MTKEQTLGDLGERRIIQELLVPRYSQGNEYFGDDCVRIPIARGPRHLIATTDPCPIPMSSLLGIPDFFHWGWLLATINLSDLAAAAATPVGILTSLVLPSTMWIRDFTRLLDGLDACCKTVDTKVVGGNLKEGPTHQLSATALGFAESPTSRRGAREGDLVLVVGDLGRFWAGYMTVRHKLNVSDSVRDYLIEPILRPQPKIHCALDLAASSLTRAAIDVSDGLYPAISCLGKANSLSAELNFCGTRFSPEVRAVAGSMGIDPVRLALGWGDWQLIVAVDPDDLASATEVCYRHGLDSQVIGRLVREHSSRVLAKTTDGHGRLMPLDSERFVANSWFSVGIDSYVATMLTAPLVEPLI